MKPSMDKLSRSPLALAGLITASAVYAGRQVARRRRRIDFAGKTVVISGGSRGLGLELARAFASEGANIALLARDENNLQRGASQLQQFGSRVTPLVCDVGDHDQVKQTIAFILGQHQQIDVLVNNAGIIQVGPLENMAREDYERSMRTHFWVRLI